MKFKVTLQKKQNHTELVSCVGWSSSDELFSAADDHLILKWSANSDDTTQITKLSKEVFPTDLHWFPANAGGKRLASDLFVLASTDGKFHLISKSGRVEKSVEAHRGAVLMARWSHDGTALVTVGEDGQVKIWSRSGMLRSTLSQLETPVYGVAWSPDSDHVLYTNDKQMVIKPLQPSMKPIIWKAHENLILKVDWSPVNNLIISGSEDRRYKVWDSFGRLIYSSQPHDYPITSVSWSSDGQLFAIGSFDTLRLCDKAGWSHSLEKVPTGSVLNISWTSDGTQLAGACGGGQVLLAQIIDRRLEWRNLEVLVQDESQIDVRDLASNFAEKLEFSQRIVKVCLGWGHLVVTTPTQCYIYKSSSWNTPAVFDLRDSSVFLIELAEKHFLLIDNTGLLIYSYEGRPVSSPKLPGLRPNVISSKCVSLSNDTLAVQDQKDEKIIHIFDALSGKEMGDSSKIKHHIEIIDVALDLHGPSTQRHLAFVDKNKELYLARINSHTSANRIAKLGTMVSSMCWSDCCNILATVQDTKQTTWFHPAVAFVDKDILAQTCSERDITEFGRNPEVVSFIGNHCRLRRMDGAWVSSDVSPYPSVLHQHAQAGRWEEAVRLCRFVKDGTVWACLAAMATVARDLNTAEIAYAAIHEVSKVEYLASMKDIPSVEGRNAAWALFSHQPNEAERILIQAGLVYRAIELNMQLHNWTRALKLAIQYKTHVDTVVAYRQKYLTEFGKKESNKTFIQCAAQTEIHWDTIQVKIEAELEKERQRAGARS
ncbi:intraflagellar transport protein 80 homolog [Oscarella lobularis]|uniref:intraflagellar transport protein 80 homolog n=1 Tax=Oscarella lobularis TaxID=121494 RepID=UPI003313BA10